jgi:hypothetical protein
VAEIHGFRKALLAQQLHQAAIHFEGDGPSRHRGDGASQIAEAGANLHSGILGLEARRLDDAAGQLSRAQEVLASGPRGREPVLGQKTPNRASTPRA